MNELINAVSQCVDESCTSCTERTCISGAEILVCSLLRQGVRIIFGFPGGSVIPVYDVLYDTTEIQHVLVRHEQGATHAADGYARATGRAGVVIVTSGPGAANTVTGIANAYMDSIPMVVFAGQVASSSIGKESFQEADILGVTRSITKHNFQLRDVRDVAEVVHKAFFIAESGRPGPVLVELPVDVMKAKCQMTANSVDVSVKGYNPQPESGMEDIILAADALNRAEKPVIYAGGGVISSGAWEELLKIAEKLDAPVTTTLLGIGSFPEDHRLSLGMLGMHGTWFANMAVTEADTLLAVGARFDDRVTGLAEQFAPEARIIHIDIDPTCIDRTVAPEISIVGDARRMLSRLMPMLQDKTNSQWFSRIQQWKKDHPVYRKTGTEKGVSAQDIILQVSDMTSDNTIICTDVGQNQMWAAQNYVFKNPRTLITSGGLGTMGFGLPSALGASFGQPDRKVIAITGDGGFQMTVSELATASQYNVPVIIVMLNNGFLGMVRQWQQLFYEKRYSSTEIGSSNPDFVNLAESYGVNAVRVQTESDFTQQFSKALSMEGPMLIEVVINKEDNVFPMVPGGKPLSEMIEKE